MKLGTATPNGNASAAQWYDADELKWAVRHWAARIGVAVPQVGECISPDQASVVVQAGEHTSRSLPCRESEGNANVQRSTRNAQRSTRDIR